MLSKIQEQVLWLQVASSSASKTKFLTWQNKEVQQEYNFTQIEISEVD